MITKTHTQGSLVCQTTFRFHAPCGVNAVSVCGDFNRWTPGVHSLAPDEDGAFTITLPLAVGERFQFKYLLDNGEWHNDHQADAYEANEWGAINSVVETGNTAAAEAVFLPVAFGVLPAGGDDLPPADKPAPVRKTVRRPAAPRAEAARKAASPKVKTVAAQKAPAKKAPKKASKKAAKKSSSATRKPQEEA